MTNDEMSKYVHVHEKTWLQNDWTLKSARDKNERKSCKTDKFIGRVMTDFFLTSVRNSETCYAAIDEVQRPLQEKNNCAPQNGNFG